jgi:hypothetical protein
MKSSRWPNQAASGNAGLQFCYKLDGLVAPCLSRDVGRQHERNQLREGLSVRGSSTWDLHPPASGTPRPPPYAWYATSSSCWCGRFQLSSLFPDAEPGSFWLAASIYGALSVTFALFFGLNSSGFSTRDLHDLDVMGFGAFLLGIFVVLFAQIPCIVFLRKHQSPNQHLQPTPR